MRFAAAKLKTNGMFERVKAKKARAVAMQHRTRGEHLGIDHSPPCEQTVEIPAMAIGPFHHRSDTESTGQTLRRFVHFFSHLSSFIHSRCRTISG
jgi:hypothetical protein